MSVPVRPLFTVVAIVMAPLFAVDVVWRLAILGNEAAMINGGLVAPVNDAGRTAFGGVLLISFGWGVSILAAVTVAAVPPRGPGLSPWAALRQAKRRLPLAAGLAPALALAGLSALFSGPALTLVLVGAVVALCAYALDLALDPVFITVGLVAVVTMAWAVAHRLTRLALVAPVAMLEGLPGRAAYQRARDLGRGAGRTGLVTGLLLLGGLFAWILTSGGGDFGGPAPVWIGAAVGFATDLGLIVVVAAQAALLALVYRRSGACLAGTDSGTDAGESSRSRWLWFALAGVLAATPSLLVAAALVVNPYRLPHWSVTTSDVDGVPVAAQWPSGQHPVIITGSQVVDCLDDQCQRQTRWGSDRLSRMTATVGADGAVMLAEAVGAEGRDVVRLERCTRGGHCTRSEVPWHTGPDGARPPVVAVSTPDGAILVATARPLPGGRVELAITRCADLACATPQLTILGTVPEPAPAAAPAEVAGLPRRDPLALRAGPDGVAELRYWGGQGRAASPVVCAPACALAPVPNPTPASPVAFSDGGYGLLTENASGDDGVSLGMLDAVAAGLPTRTQFVLVECADPGCHTQGQRWRLNIVEHAHPTGLLVVTPDRRVLIVEATDRMLIATTTLPGTDGRIRTRAAGFRRS